MKGENFIVAIFYFLDTPTSHIGRRVQPEGDSVTHIKHEATSPPGMAATLRRRLPIGGTVSTLFPLLFLDHFSGDLSDTPAREGGEGFEPRLLVPIFSPFSNHPCVCGVECTVSNPPTCWREEETLGTKKSAMRVHEYTCMS